MSNIQVIEQDIRAIQPTFERMLAVNNAKGISFEAELGFALQVLGNNDYALKVALSNRQSVVDAATNVAAIGISLNPVKKQAYLVPRDGRICLDISYLGLMDLAIQGGAVKWHQAGVVRDGDVFELRGLDAMPVHTYNPFAADRAEKDVVGVYVTVKTADGDYLTHAMSTAEINAIRDRSSAWKSYLKTKRTCPWVTDWGEMAKKTVVKQGSKYWPRGDSDRFAQAIHYVNVESGEGLADLAPETPTTDVTQAIAEAKTREQLDALWSKHEEPLRKAKNGAAWKELRAACQARSKEIDAESVTDVPHRDIPNEEPTNA